MSGEFRSLRPVKLAVVYNVVRDLLLTDFGMESDWAMDARQAFLDIRGHDTIYDNRISLHPASALALYTWLGSQRLDSARPEGRRLRRLVRETGRMMMQHAAHPWFHGRRIPGSTADPLPAWFNAGFLYAYPPPSNNPVILRPVVSKGPHGMNVTYFEMEKVECPTS